MNNRPIQAEDKVFIDANTLLVNSFRLARKIWDSGYRPNYLVGLWRGGTPVGAAIQEFFRVRGHDPYHTAIKTQSYVGLRQGGEVEVKGLEHVIDIVESEEKMLLVDDVFDTGHTLARVLEVIREKARKNTPELRAATIYYKPEKNETDLVPDYYLIEDNRWLVFPHELDGLTPDEVRRKGLGLFDLVFG
ncbi:MAG TPA: phosphoribosyltransferase family protein [Acidobacteriota bacterium]